MGWLFMLCALVLGVVSVGFVWFGLLLGVVAGWGDAVRALQGFGVALLGVLGMVLAARAAALAVQVLCGEVRQ